MPYSTVSDLPKSVQALPTHAQEIYKAAFNSAYEEYKDKSNREALAHATAWTAVKNKYKKQGDKWVVKEATKTMSMAVKFADEEKGIIKMLAIPFGGPFEGKDIDGEFFTKSTDLCLDWFVGGRPILYQHGVDTEMKTEVCGRDTGEYEVTDEGVWLQAQLNKSAKYWNAISALVKSGKLFGSTQSIHPLVRKAVTGEILRWPWIETSLSPTPSNYFSRVDPVKAVEDLRSLGIDVTRMEEEAEWDMKALYFKIEEKEGAPKSPPKGYPTDASQYGDPKNFKYPIDKKHINAAVGYFNHPGNQKKGGYSDSEWATIGKRIAAAANKLIGPGHSFADGKIETKEAKAMETETAQLTEIKTLADDLKQDGKQVAKKDACPTCGRDMPDATPPAEDDTQDETDDQSTDQKEPQATNDAPGVSMGMAPETHQPAADRQNVTSKTVEANAQSVTDARSQIMAAMQQRYGAPWGPGAVDCYVVDVLNDGTFVFSAAGVLYKLGYGGDPVTVSGEPVAVTQRTVYDTVPITTAGAKSAPVIAELIVADSAIKALLDESKTALKAVTEELEAAKARLEKLEAQPLSDGPHRRVMPEGLRIAANSRMGIQGGEPVEVIEDLLAKATDPAIKAYLNDQISYMKMQGIMGQGIQRIK